MALQIGRLTGLNEPGSWDASSEHVTLTGSYKAVTLADGLRRREQLLGYAANPDEAVIPIAIDGETRINGFYRPLAVHVLTDEFVRKQGNLYDFTIDMDRVRSFNAASLESIMVGALMTNGSGVAAGTDQPWQAVPANVVAWAYQTITPSQAAVRISQEGTMEWLLLRNGATNIYGDVARYTIPIADYYRGAARIEDDVGLSSQYTMVGTQFAPQTYANWRLSNALVRVRAYSTTGISVAWYNSGAWGPWHDFVLGPSSNGLYLNSCRILRNAIEEVIIRLSGTIGPSPAFSAPINCDIALRRGAEVVRGFMASASGYTFANWAVKSATTIAHTALTGGIYATAADSQAVKQVLTVSKAFTTDLVNGAITQTGTLATCDFGIGGDMSGLTYNVGQDLIYQYLAAQGERMQVVGR